MPTVNLQPTQNDNTVTLLRKFLQAVNLYWGGALPSQPVNVDVTINEEGDTIIVPAVPTVSTVEVSSGNVGGYSHVSGLRIATSVTNYTDGDAVGGVPRNIYPFRSGKVSAILQSITLVDTSGVGPDLRLMIAGVPGTFATTADGDAVAVATAPTLLAVIPVAAGDWVDLGTAKVASVGGLGHVLAGPPGGAPAVGLAVIAAGAWACTVVNGLYVQLGFLQD